MSHDERNCSDSDVETEQSHDVDEDLHELYHHGERLHEEDVLRAESRNNRTLLDELDDADDPEKYAALSRAISVRKKKKPTTPQEHEEEFLRQQRNEERRYAMMKREEHIILKQVKEVSKQTLMEDVENIILKESEMEAEAIRMSLLHEEQSHYGQGFITFYC